MEKSSTGLDANVAGLLAYVAGWVTGLIFFLIEKGSTFVRFHAVQSLIFNIAFVLAHIVVFVLTLILSKMHMAFVGSLLSGGLSLGGLAVWIICMIKAYQNEKFKLPIIGDMAEKYAALPPAPPVA